jgi:aconitate hydratase
MSPEYGATCGFFPVDDETLKYLRLTGRDEGHVALVEAYCRENALWHDPAHEPEYSQVVELDLADVEPSLAGPRRPQDRVPLREAKQAFVASLETFGVDYGNGQDAAVAESFPASDPPASVEPGSGRPGPGESIPAAGGAVTPHGPVAVAIDGQDFDLEHGSVVIAAITSCTNTSNPAGDDRGRPPREERGRTRHAPEAMGEVEPRSGL